MKFFFEKICSTESFKGVNINTDLIDVVGIGRFTNGQIERLKKKIKFQSGYIKSFIYQSEKIAKKY